MLPASLGEFLLLMLGIVLSLAALALGAYWLGNRKPKHGIVAASLLSLGVLSIASPVFLGGTSEPVSRLIEPYKYNIAGWEISNASSQLLQRMLHPLSRPDPTSEESVAKLKAFFELTQQVSRTKSEIATAEARLQTSAVSANLDTLDGLYAKQEELKFEAELILERLVTLEAEKEGLTRGFLGLRFMWPPVGIAIENRPGVLAVSARDHIQLETSVLLNSGVSRDTREAIEGEIAAINLSGLVVGIGGVATYPAILPDDGNLEAALEIAAHEWLHHYLYFHPLGRNYYSGGGMTSINETVANMWGKEIGKRLYCQHFATCAPEVVQPRTTPPPTQVIPPTNTFDFNREMRATRLRVDQLLKDGKIQEAEDYMEARRKFFVENNHFIRKLNQAYFAFFGSYGDEPSVISPIGDMLRLVRANQTSVGDFIRQVREIGNREEFDATFAEVKAAS